MQVLKKTETESIKQNVPKAERATYSLINHISLVFFLWDIGKQNNPRCDAAKRGVPSGAILFAGMIFSKK